MVAFLCLSFMSNYVCLYSSICWTIYQMIFMYMNSYRSSYNHYGLFELEVFMFLRVDLLPIKQLFVFAVVSC